MDIDYITKATPPNKFGAASLARARRAQKSRPGPVAKAGTMVAINRRLVVLRLRQNRPHHASGRFHRAVGMGVLGKVAGEVDPALAGA